MGRLEERSAIADVGARCNSEPTDLGRAGVGEIVAVQVRRRENVVFIRAQEQLLEHRVRNPVLDQDLADREFPFKIVPEFALRDDLLAKLPLRQRIAPIAEGPLGELHDIALVDQRDALPTVIERVLDRPANQAFGAGPR